MAGDQSTGGWIEFQGDHLDSKRHFYSEDTIVANASFSPDHAGANTGPAETTSSQNRGREELYWTEPSQIPIEVGDTQTRWIGLDTRDTKREMGPSTPAGNFSQDNGVFLSMPRMVPEIHFSCAQPDDIDDEWMTMRPTYFRET